MNEIRLHGRGSQGVVMASEILALAFVLEEKYATAFPSFGKGVFRITHKVKNPKPVQYFTRLTNRYAHLTPRDLQVLQKAADSCYAFIVKLAQS